MNPTQTYEKTMESIIKRNYNEHNPNIFEDSDE
jgi:hypothetical protein